MKIRIATPEDASAIQSIYRYYVEHTAITFELEVPSVEEFQEELRRPWSGILIWWLKRIV